MKKQIALLAVVASPLAIAADMPTVYGKVNKVVSYTDQDAVHGRKTMDGLTDVHNSESRIGVMGEVPTMSESMNAAYKIELGLNSTKNDTDADTTERIRIRLAEVALKSSFGTITFGQTYNPFSKNVLASDPLIETVAGSAGSDQKERIAKADTVGFNYRARVDGVTYATPSLMGFTYTVSTDRDNKNYNVSGDDNYGATHYEHMLNFSRAFGGFDFTAYAGYHKWDLTGMKDMSEMLYGIRAKTGGLTINAAMTSEEQEKAGTTVKYEVDRMYASLSYNMDKHTFSATYQTRENRNVSNTKKNKDADLSQIALGYKHQCSKNIDLNLTALQFKVEDKSGLTGDNKKLAENDATQVTLGMQLKF